MQFSTDPPFLRRVEPELALFAELLCVGREHALLVGVLGDGPAFLTAPNLGAAASTSIVAHHWPCAPSRRRTSKLGWVKLVLQR
jgi:hypothetical protein